MSGPLRALRYVRMPMTDLAAASRFATEIVGLEPAGTGDAWARFRCDSRYYALECDASGATERPVIAIEVDRADDLAVIAERLGAASIAATRLPPEQCARRRCRDALAFRDHGGNDIELVARPDDNPRRYFPTRDAGIRALSHVAIGSDDVDRDLALWTGILGARLTDRVGTAAYLSFDRRHHQLSLHPSTRRPRFVDLTFEVESLDAIMQASYFLAERQVRIVRGPGREPAGNAIFVTFAGPDGLFVSYATDMAALCDEWRPRQLAPEPWSFCAWGGPTELAEYGRTASS